MSALIFYTDSTQVLVVTDTLATKPDGSPFLFTSKAHYLPHLRTIVAGTGVGGFSISWCEHVNSRMVLCGIDNLDYHTPASLRILWAEYKAKYELDANMSSTIYHFGFSEESGEVVSYVYRSTADYASERLSYGTGVKPECSVPEGNLFDHIRTMMDEQRSIQATKSLDKRVFIGGEAIAIHLTKDICNIFRLFQFPEFSDQMQLVFKNYAKNMR